MTPEQKLKHAILLLAAKWKDITLAADAEITAENVDALYEEHDEGGMLQDARSEIRSTGEETGLSAPGSRNYETEAVAKQMPDGSWVGWTHYYGGGKHSEPDAIPWMGDAYDLICTEEQVTVTKRTFAKIPACPLPRLVAGAHQGDERWQKHKALCSLQLNGGWSQSTTY